MLHEYVGEHGARAESLPRVDNGDSKLSRCRVVVVCNETRNTDGVLGTAIGRKGDHDKREVVILVDLVDKSPQHRRVEVIEWREEPQAP